MPRRVGGKWLVVGSVAGLAFLALGLLDVLIAAPFQDARKNESDDGGAPAARAAGPAPSASVKGIYGGPLPPGALRRFGTVRYRQSSAIYRIAVTSDGKYVVTDGEDSELRVWDAEDGHLIKQFNPDVGAMSDFALTSDGKFVMTTGIESVLGRKGMRYVALHALPDGQAEDHGSWAEPLFGSEAVALCPDRKLLALSRGENGVQIVDAWTGAETYRFEIAHGDLQRIVFSRDGQHVAVHITLQDDIHSEQELKIYDPGKKKEEGSIRWKDFISDVEDLALSPDGNEIAAAVPLVPKIWDLDSGKFFVFPNSAAHRISYTADGRFLVTMGTLGRLCTIDTAAHRRKSSVETGCHESDRIASSPDGRFLFTTGGSNVLHRWDVQTGRDRFAVADAHGAPVTALGFSPDGKTLMTASEDERIRLWDFATGRQKQALQHQNFRRGTKFIAATADGRSLIVAEEHQVSCWDLAKGEVAWASSRKSGVGHWLAALALGDSGRSVLAATRDGSIRRWNLQAQKKLEAVRLQITPPADEGPMERSRRLFNAAFLADGRYLAALGNFRGLRVFDARTGRERFQRPKIRGRFLVPSPNMRTLAVAEDETVAEFRRGRRRMAEMGDASPRLVSTGGTIRLVDGETGEVLHRIEISGSPVWGMAFSPDGEMLVATNGWGTGAIHLYDVAKGKELRTIAVPPLYTNEDAYLFKGGGVVFAPDGRQLVTAMADGSVLAWDVTSEKPK